MVVIIGIVIASALSDLLDDELGETVKLLPGEKMTPEERRKARHGK
ncbi:MAG: hypothetical protein ACPGJW_09065 [Paracoccaceae bacterium]